MSTENKSLALLNPTQKENVNLAVQQGVVALAGRMQLVDHVIKQMEEGVHYGASFPGDKKKNLLKPGADYLGVAFRLVPSFEVERIDLPNGHREYSVNCKVTGPDSYDDAGALLYKGQMVANGVGSCSTMESKYRYRNASRKCPMCGKDTIIKGKAEYGGGWLCFGKKGGCGEKFSDDDQAIIGQEVGKIENTDPADQYNTCLKIAKKRAQVDAMITATGCSAEFTQDAEDMRHEEAPAPARQAAPAQQQAAPAPAGSNTPPPPPSKTLEGMPDLNALAEAMNKAADKAALDAAWKDVVAIQTKLQSADLTALMKIRKANQARFA